MLVDEVTSLWIRQLDLEGVHHVFCSFQIFALPSIWICVGTLQVSVFSDHMHPERSALVFAADDSVSRMMYASSWYLFISACTRFASASANTIAWYSASAELKLTLPSVRLSVAIVLPASRSTLPVVLCVLLTQPRQSSHASIGDGSNFQI